MNVKYLYLIIYLFFVSCSFPKKCSVIDRLSECNDGDYMYHVISLNNKYNDVVKLNSKYKEGDIVKLKIK